MTNVLVTGGAGYIGAHACKALAASGYRPVVFDNLVYGHREAVKWGPLVEGDLQDRGAVDAVLAGHDIAAVMHFAAYAYVGESVEDPAKYYRNNILGTLNLADAMRGRGLDTLVFSSTCATYGIPERMPIGEDTPQQPINPYGQSKLMCEQIIRDFAVAYGLRAVMPRYFNACGADPDGEVGEDHEPEPHLIPLALRAADGGAPLTVFGDDYPTPDGTCIRDYIHVTDLADAHVAALDYLRGGGETLAVNLGTGRGISVREILGAVEQVTGKAVPHSVGPRRAGDPAVLVADPALAARTIGWTAAKSDIATIVETAWAWHRSRRQV